MPIAWAIFINVLLIVAFVVPHSVMARPSFKKWWTRYIPAPIERSTYVLVSCLLMINLLLNWQPTGGIVWNVSQPVAYWSLLAIFLLGVLLVPAVSLMINHFDLFGTRQVWLYLQGKEYTHLEFRTPMAYRFARHPLYVGWMLFFWVTPTMTVSHLLLAVLTTLYMLAAIPFEERDLVSHFGEKYLNYRRRVGALFPKLHLGNDNQVSVTSQSSET